MAEQKVANSAVHSGDLKAASWGSKWAGETERRWAARSAFLMAEHWVNCSAEMTAEL